MPPDTKGRAVNLRLSEARLIYCIAITLCIWRHLVPSCKVIIKA